MARRELSQDPRAVKTRNAIIKTTTELLNEHRVEDITVSQIVNAAGMSRQVFYEHFKDRDAAVKAAIQRAMAPAVNDYIETYKKTGEMPPALEALFSQLAEVRCLLSHVINGPAHATLMACFTTPEMPMLHDMVTAMRAEVVPMTDEEAADVASYLCSGAFSIFMKSATESENYEEAVKRAMGVFGVFGRAMSLPQ
ncbi:TetR/AcrR family transcriptional regulator [Corynebacterium pseudogenitalium]|uniref:TetR/AcrR family transcriptional regulator n=1 Tax=Corynebacterium pseudogenitalium TaxID=38303 RepID=UPI00210A2B77|nr:TetR/AcrR family transcriptional regulator [Corynebacterium pseudogenitalium]MCQ4608095.1 TetR/AcrR family transcriptional regulator [Corynebacterium pseudogenitalium]